MWRLVTTPAGRESEFVRHCVMKGARAYAPMRRVLVKPKRKRRAHLKIVPAFPRYVFVQSEADIASLAQDWPGVARVVQFGTDVPGVPDRHVRAIQTIEQSGLLDDAIPGKARLKVSPGDKYKIDEGAMAGLEGDVDKVIDEAKGLVRLLVNGWKLDLPLAILSKIEHN